jgi:hypothetical protein
MKTIAQQLNVKEFPFIIKDKNRNKIYFEDSHGNWYKWEYDSKGDKIYLENSTGCWWKYKYDSNRNLIYFEDSYGLWIKQEYDSDGNVVYREDSDGDIEDNRPKPCENLVVEIDGIKYKLTVV